jgi:rod shape-determining protein MreC
MPQGALDRTPPPFFRQGPSAFSRLVVFASMAVCLMAADRRLELIRPVRAAVAVVLYPVEQLLLTPLSAWTQVQTYLGGIHAAQDAEARARAALTLQAQQALLTKPLSDENARLRALLDLRARLSTPARAAEVLYDAADPFTRKMVIDQGSLQGIELSSPVVNEAGVLGQVTRVYPATSEVTLLTDRNASIPVLNSRTQQRSIAVGDPVAGGMELRFLAANGDVQVGDVLSTSGVDGVYPGGYPVAKVTHVDRRADNTNFAKIQLELMTRPDGVRHLLVLVPLGKQLPARPEPVASAPAPGRKASGRH